MNFNNEVVSFIWCLVFRKEYVQQIQLNNGILIELLEEKKFLNFWFLKIHVLMLLPYHHWLQIAAVGGWKGQTKCIFHFLLVGIFVGMIQIVHIHFLKLQKEPIRAWTLCSPQLHPLTREL